MTQAIHTLVDASRTLAQTAIDEARVTGKPSKITKARQEMGWAEQDVQTGKFVNAIAHFGRAWVYAQQAVGRLILAADDVTLIDQDNADGDQTAAGQQIYLPMICK